MSQTSTDNAVVSPTRLDALMESDEHDTGRSTESMMKLPLSTTSPPPHSAELMVVKGSSEASIEPEGSAIVTGHISGNFPSFVPASGAPISADQAAPIQIEIVDLTTEKALSPGSLSNDALLERSTDSKSCCSVGTALADLTLDQATAVSVGVEDKVDENSQMKKLHCHATPTAAEQQQPEFLEREKIEGTSHIGKGN